MHLGSSSLFEIVTRYEVAEDKLTQVFAGVLERAPRLAGELARAWTAPTEHAAREVASEETRAAHELLPGLELNRVRTQVPTRNGKEVDLELRFGHPHHLSDQDVVIWVEVKRTADPHEGQITNYLDALPAAVRAACVVLLAPRASLPYTDRGDIPPSVPQRSWQRTGRVIEQAARHGPEGTVERFLLEELVKYMREDNLIDPAKVGPELLVALAYANQAEAALERLCEEAHRILATQFREPDGVGTHRSKPAYGWEYYDAWDLVGQGDDALLWADWNAWNGPELPEAEGRSLVFLSGLTADAVEHLLTEPEAVKRLEDGVSVDGDIVKLTRISDGENERLARVAMPEEVLIGRTLEEQAASLARWIGQGLRAIELARGSSI